MRVIAGTLGGRQFDSPKRKSTHPMSEKMRGAIFSALGDIQGLSVLDAYSGSGALAIEAYSRGAERIIAIDGDKSAVATIRQNLDDLNIDNDAIKVIQARIEGWLNTSEDRFDLIFADPPFDAAKASVIARLMSRINQDGLLILSWPGNMELPHLGALVKSIEHGDGRLGFFRPS